MRTASRTRPAAPGPWLNKLFQAAFSAAKRVRSETQIGANAVSLASATVSLARRMYADLGAHTCPHDRCRRDDRAHRSAFRRRRHQTHGDRQSHFEPRTSLGGRGQGLRGRLERPRQGAGGRRHRRQLHCEFDAAHHEERGRGGGARSAPSPDFHGRSGGAARHRARRSRNSRISICFRSTICSSWSTKTVNSGNSRPAVRGCSSRRKWPAFWPNRGRMTRDPQSGPCASRPTPSVSKPWSRRGACWRPANPAEEVIEYLANTLTNRLLHSPTQALRQASESADSALAETLVRTARRRTRTAITRGRYNSRP